jgi:2-deoxy-D-gluconate 3-dehydrogenase
MILDSFKLTGKNALVTGSRTGLGRAMAIGLAEAGANVMVHGSKENGLDDVCSAIRATGAKSARVTADLSDQAAAPRLMEAMLAEFGSIDILINNAGIARRKAAADFSLEDWNLVIQVNLTSVFQMAQLAGREMIKKGRGKIINVASLLSFQGGILVPAYSAAKGGIATLTMALANEWAPKGVNVNAIAPGYMSTDLTAALENDPARNRAIVDRIPAGRWGSPKDLAGAAVFLASSASDYVHGAVLAVDCGWLGR